MISSQVGQVGRREGGGGAGSAGGIVAVGVSILDDKLKRVSEAHSAERVLIVEDDPATRSGLTELVRTWGFTAEEAADGTEALEKVTSFRPSIVVTDLVMPRMSGIELLKALQPEIDNIGDPVTRRARSIPPSRRSRPAPRTT